MDELDLASEREDIERQHCIRRAAQAPTQRLAHRGTCHSCDEDVPPPRLFCDAGCAEAWEIRRGRVARGR